jgi:hypothetical protein
MLAGSSQISRNRESSALQKMSADQSLQFSKLYLADRRTIPTMTSAMLKALRALRDVRD